LKTHSSDIFLDLAFPLAKAKPMIRMAQHLMLVALPLSA
jgi:hypothetical protein